MEIWRSKAREVRIGKPRVRVVAGRTAINSEPGVLDALPEPRRLGYSGRRIVEIVIHDVARVLRKRIGDQKTLIARIEDVVRDGVVAGVVLDDQLAVALFER